MPCVATSSRRLASVVAWTIDWPRAIASSVSGECVGVVGLARRDFAAGELRRGIGKRAPIVGKDRGRRVTKRRARKIDEGDRVRLGEKDVVGREVPVHDREITRRIAKGVQARQRVAARARDPDRGSGVERRAFLEKPAPQRLSGRARFEQERAPMVGFRSDQLRQVTASACRGRQESRAPARAPLLPPRAARAPRPSCRRALAPCRSGRWRPRRRSPRRDARPAACRLAQSSSSICRCHRQDNEYAPPALGGCSSVGRALDCGSSCRGFNPRHSPPKTQQIQPLWPEEGSFTAQPGGGALRDADLQGVTRSRCGPCRPCRRPRRR